MPNTDWYTENQERTVVTATAHREPWTPDDLDFVVKFTDDCSDTEIALALGRTLHAVSDIQWEIKRRGIAAVRAGYAPRAITEARRVANAPTYDFVTTFPPGWND